MRKQIILLIISFLLIFVTKAICEDFIVPEGFVLVESGSFIIGTTKNKVKKSLHEVTISKNYFIGKYEVTQHEWLEIMGNNPAQFKGDNFPVESVSWYDAVEYCNRRSINEGLTPCYSVNGDNIYCDFSVNGYRLPTEAEWEFAARGGNKSKGYLYAGSNSINEVAWYSKNSKVGKDCRTSIVGQKMPNELGLYDMSGNVYEWCWDWVRKYKFATDQADPHGPSVGKLRVDRGGSAFIYARCCRVIDRNSAPPLVQKHYLGFRLVRTAD